eukprot:595756-Pyramimonas_sp.AAC.1
MGLVAAASRIAVECGFAALHLGPLAATANNAEPLYVGLLDDCAAARQVVAALAPPNLADIHDADGLREATDAHNDALGDSLSLLVALGTELATKE